MKIKIHKINITAEFTNEQELANLLNNIADEYKQGFRNKKGVFIKWLAHEKQDYTEVNISIDDIIEKHIKFETRDKEDYMIIPSKINFLQKKIKKSLVNTKVCFIFAK